MFVSGSEQGMKSAQLPASTDQTVRRSARNHLLSKNSRMTQPAKIATTKKELESEDENQTRENRQEANAQDPESTNAKYLSVIEKVSAKEKAEAGGADHLKALKKPKKSSETLLTKTEAVEEILKEEQSSQGLKRNRITKQEKPTGEVEAQEVETHTPKTSPRKRKIEKLSIGTEGEEEIEEGEESPEKPKRKRKTKEEKEAEEMPLAARSNGLKMFVGAHVSSAKGVHNAVTNSVHIGGNAFALFLKSQRKWENPPLQYGHKAQFKALAAEHRYDAASHILPHGSYLVNLAQEDPAKASQAYTAFLDDLHRCEALGIKLYNFHPGSTGSSPRPAAIARIASHLNAAHASTTTITPVLETMAGAGNVIGSTFSDLRDIIALVKDKSRIGVCLDTCHVFAAGYDLRSPASFASVLDDFENTIGLGYLKALHLNDSKTPLGSHRDLHANIGTGFLGLKSFWNVMNECRFEGLPMVLETPIDREGEGRKMVEDKNVWAREIKLLESLVGIDTEGEEFRNMEERLAKEGEKEREKHQEAFDKKMEKEKKGKEKGKTEKINNFFRKKKAETERGSDG